MNLPERATLRDIDLAPINRTQANLWTARYYEAHRELVVANRALARLSAQNKRLREKCKALERGDGQSL